MQPADRKARARSALAARVRMFLKADLGWLHGYPLGVGADGVRWVCTPEDRTDPEGLRTIDRETLHRATRSWSKATRRYGAVLPDAVDHARQWARRVPVVLDALKPSVHEGAPFPASLLEHGWDPPVVERVRALVRRHPDLAGLVDALSWSLFTTPHRLPEYLAHLEAATSETRALLGALEAEAGTRVGIRLIWLALGHGDAVRPLLRAMADEAREPAPTTGAARHAATVRSALRGNARKARKKGLPSRPVATTLAALDRWSAALLGRPPEVCGRALVLLGATLPDLEVWRAWWREMDACTASIPGLLLGRPPPREHLEAMVERLGVACRDAPPELPLSRLLEVVDTAASDDWQPWHEAALAALRAVPRRAAPLARPCLLACWTDASVDVPRPLATWLPLLGPWLAAMPDDLEVLLPWMELWGDGALKATTFWSFDHLVCEECRDPSRMEALLAFLGHLYRTERDLWTPRAFDNAATLVSRAPPSCTPEDLVPLLRRLALGERYLPNEAYEAAAALSGLERPFPDLLAALSGGEAGDPMSLLQAVRALQACSEPVRAAAAQLLLDGEGHRLLRAGPELSALATEGRTVPLPTTGESATSPEWVRAYPPTLHPSLAHLAAAHPNPRRAAERILGADLPTREALERELAAIEARLAEGAEAPGLRKRRDMLRRRIASPVPPSPARMARLVEKVDRAARRAALEAWESRVNAAFGELLGTLLDVADLGEWVQRPRVAACLAHALALDKPFRDLALAVFRRRCGPPPWDLRDDPANARFLDRLDTIGIDPTPWLDPFERRVEVKGGRLRVHLERDPAEVLFMGGHFHTCLSPGAFNFFSVIVNIADVNKAVLYARDQDDRVVGRCLLALTGNGGLLPFHPYAHGEDIDFPDVVREVIADLASAMGTVVVKEGEVPTLLAPEWYDDGPEDLAKGFVALAPGAPFREALSKTPLEGFAARCAEALAPVGVNALTLPHLLGLPEIAQRPELVLPLLPAVERMDPRDAGWALALPHLSTAGATGRMARLLRSHAVPYLQSLRGEVDLRVMEPLVCLEPSLALRALQRTRRRGFRTLEDEHPERRYWGARALESLHRPQQALAHYRAIVEGPPEWGGIYRKFSQERIAALEAQLPGE